MIDRAVQLARATSSTTSAVVLVASNLIPLAGVLFWGWNVATLLVLYWVENGIVGLLNVPKILLAQGPEEPATRVVDVRGLGPVTVARSGPTAKAALVPFFLFHYGIFWLVHGVFVFTLPLFIGGVANAVGPGVFVPDPGLGSIALDTRVVPTRSADLSAVAVGAIALTISHMASFLINYLGRGEYRRTTAARQVFAPYSRLVILHLTIILGAFLSLAIGSPIGAIVALVLLKTMADLGFHLREHSRPASIREPASS